MRYIRPTSLTWWAGFLAILIGVLQLALPESVTVSELAVALDALTGEGATSPGQMIALGAGLIGLRDAIKRATG